MNAMTHRLFQISEIKSHCQQDMKQTLLSGVSVLGFVTFILLGSVFAIFFLKFCNNSCSRKIRNFLTCQKTNSENSKLKPQKPAATQNSKIENWNLKSKSENRTSLCSISNFEYSTELQQKCRKYSHHSPIQQSLSRIPYRSSRADHYSTIQNIQFYSEVPPLPDVPSYKNLKNKNQKL